MILWQTTPIEEVFPVVRLFRYPGPAIMRHSNDLSKTLITFIKRNVRNVFHRVGFDIKHYSYRQKGVWNNPPSTKKHQEISTIATYSPWLNDSDFLETYNQIKEHTLVDIYRCYELWALGKQTSDIDGDILEVGVWRGGTGTILAKAIKNISGKKVFLADTFTGVVKAGNNDTCYKGGEHSDTSINIVKRLLASLSLSNTEILHGIFPEDSHNRINGNISMLHCDVDVYTSCKDIVEWCLPRLSIGSILVFDDYGFSGCEGVTTYCDEFREVKGFRFIYNLNGHAIFIKIES